ncbi:MAG: zf-HC2 domain-containing protein [Thermoanaerobaculia bacterium]
MSQKYITCEEVITFLLSYLSGELSAEKAGEFERHLAVCPSCVHYLKTYKATVELGRNALGGTAEPGPSALAPEMVRAILALRPPG